jgi:hypothetical protein
MEEAAESSLTRYYLQSQKFIDEVRLVVPRTAGDALVGLSFSRIWRSRIRGSGAGEGAHPTQIYVTNHWDRKLEHGRFCCWPVRMPVFGARNSPGGRLGGRRI